jgi:Homeodomain-like domain
VTRDKIEEAYEELANEITRAAEKTRAVELRRDGLSYRQIATALGCSVSTAHSYVRDELSLLAEHTLEATVQLRAVENARIDELWRSLWPKREWPTTAAALVRLSQRRSSLNGLDAPKEVKISGGDLAAQGAEQNPHIDQLTGDEVHELSYLGTVCTHGREVADKEHNGRTRPDYSNCSHAFLERRYQENLAAGVGETGRRKAFQEGASPPPNTL